MLLEPVVIRRGLLVYDLWQVHLLIVGCVTAEQLFKLCAGRSWQCPCGALCQSRLRRRRRCCPRNKGNGTRSEDKRRCRTHLGAQTHMVTERALRNHTPSRVLSSRSPGTASFYLRHATARARTASSYLHRVSSGGVLRDETVRPFILDETRLCGCSARAPHLVHDRIGFATEHPFAVETPFLSGSEH